MELKQDIFRAILDCPHKAWQLAKDSGNKVVPQNPAMKIIVNKEDAKDKLARNTWYYATGNFQLKDKRTIEKVKRLHEEVTALSLKTEAPPFYKNAHCPECQFWSTCYSKLKERDCISLLGGMSYKMLLKYHAKGIFTILQLSHLFRLRRRRRTPKVTGRFLWELKALAIRENKTFVLQSPMTGELPSIYLDFEGLPEENFIYLIGVVIRQSGKSDQAFYFWADTSSEEQVIFKQLFLILLEYPEAGIYHYGGYETKALKKEAWQMSKEEFTAIERRMVNLLACFRTHVYPPTYTNSLKEIAGFVGYQWKEVDSSSLKSIAWRKYWEKVQEEKWKIRLIQYNLDDCLALAKVHSWLKTLSNGENAQKVQQVAEMKKHSPYSLQANPEFGADFQYINKAAYFDYQREKIYWRFDKKYSPSAKENKRQFKHPGRGTHVWQPKKANQVIQAPPLLQCPYCKHPKVYHAAKQRTFLKTDLKFLPTGIKQWIIEYRSGSGKCARCGLKYNDSVLRQPYFGDNIFAWAVNMYVNYQVSYAMVSRLLNEQFGIWANPVYFNERNYKWWQRFKPEAEYCWQILRHSPFIHIDETSVRLSKGKDNGYVWVFASPHTVFYHFSLNREAAFLHERLKDYKGVIITDFFPAYESLPMRQQKCLIHLIRDLNDDLLKAPFDEEYKAIVVGFGQLLKNIISTIDKYGLKTLYLKKHIPQTEKFYEDYVEADHKSQLSTKCAKRLKKTWDTLWTFLSQDGIPWNNNNAETAIKAFAQHRHRVNGQVSVTGLTEYLSMLTVAQTCRYRNMSFLDFLRYQVGIGENINPDLLPGYLPFKQAQLYVRKLKIRNEQDWKRWIKNNRYRSFIPSDPEVYYKDAGWQGWPAWLGNES